MIFLSLGTHEQAFPRALEMLRPLIDGGSEIVVQHGFTPVDRSLVGVRWIEFVEYDEMVDLIVRSDAFISHAGVGSILTALTNAVTPVVIPRRAEHGEHLDDHQLQLAGKLMERGLAVVAERDLGSAIVQAQGMRGAHRGPGQELQRAVALATRAPARSVG